MTAAVGRPLVIAVRTESGLSCSVESEDSLAAAHKHPLTQAVLEEQLGRLGGTNYQLRACRATIDGEPMAPLSVLGKLRHAIIERLDAMATRPPARRVAERSVLPGLQAPIATAIQNDSQSDGRESPSNSAATGQSQLHVLCRSLDHLRLVLAQHARSVMVDLQDGRQYGEAVEVAHAAGAKILIATPRIQKPDEMGLLRVLPRHGADGILARNFAGLLYYAERQISVVADFSLNATNELTVELLRRWGAERVTASYDLNREQLLDLVAAVPSAWLEVVIHQHMPMFHMEHCVFCSVLSPGTNKHNCGRPCDVHQVRLRDRVGMEHLLTADVGCRNTLFNAVPQSAAEAVPQLVARGVRDFRVELLPDATPEDVTQTLDAYRQLLAGSKSGKEVWTSLKAQNRVGVTRGTMEQRRDPLAIL